MHRLPTVKLFRWYNIFVAMFFFCVYISDYVHQCQKIFINVTTVVYFYICYGYLFLVCYCSNKHVMGARHNTRLWLAERNTPPKTRHASCLYQWSKQNMCTFEYTWPYSYVLSWSYGPDDICNLWSLTRATI